MARGDQRDQGRDGGDWQSGSRAETGREAQSDREERGRWGRESRGEQSWRPGYDPQGGRDQEEQGRYGSESGRSRNWSREREWDGRAYTGGEYGRGEYGGRGEYDAEPRRGEYGRGEFGRGEYRGGQQARGPGMRNQPETYSDLDRWERRPVDFGPDRGGGAYAGGSAGGGAYGPGGFGGPSTDRHWMGAGGSGHAPDWTSEREHERSGRHTGRGPKGYRRSQERITEDVCEALTRHPDIDASEISVRCENGEVILSGTVNDRREKRMAEDAAERIAGVTDVRNEIRVNRQGSNGFEGTQGRQAQLTGENANRSSEEQDEEQTRRGSSASRNRSGSKS